ncbi:hypothetical protein BDV23DRAFT_182780 [Aspergillus alliaceus]|uniref:Uncharacterized protein n=1 Tax=Petromyces alliaceus TaxID=209559 RepID=A0A5N7CAT8_PETAA|nr:hypothetical protein BDV23DRAFT_182780 [Aspergillus alliaceus]
MALLIERFGDAIDIPDKVPQAAAQNHGVGEKVMTIILERYGDTAKVTEEVVKAAVTLECREQADVDYSAPNTAMHKGANGGTKKTDTWQKDGGRACLGTCADDMPNLGIVLGPNTGLLHNSFILIIEAQSKYINGLDQAGAGSPKAGRGT